MLSALSRTLANAGVIAAGVGGWTLCLVQLASAYQVWRTGAGIYALPGGLAIMLYVPVLAIWLIAAPFATVRVGRLVVAAPIVGTLAMTLA